MSATGRGGKRKPGDFYPTPAPLVRSALTLAAPSHRREPVILDPGCGTGVWGLEAKMLWPRSQLAGVDSRRTAKTEMALDDAGYDVTFRANFLRKAPVRTPDAMWVAWENCRYDLIIGNPPYGKAQEFVQRSLELLAPGGVLVQLLRLSFLEGQKRAAWWKTTPLERVLVCSKRPSFTTDGGTDACAYGLFYWRQGHVGPWSGGWVG